MHDPRLTKRLRGTVAWLPNREPAEPSNLLPLLLALAVAVTALVLLWVRHA